MGINFGVGIWDVEGSGDLVEDGGLSIGVGIIWSRSGDTMED